VTVLQHTGPALTDEQREQFRAVGITVIEGAVAEVEADESGLTGVRLTDGTRVPFDALIVAPRLAARAELLAPLGLDPVGARLDEHTVGSRIEADATGATSVPGVWVAGNLADVQAQVITSAASGLATGAAINADLITEETRRAVNARRHERVHGELAWDEHYRSRPQTCSGDPNPVLVTEIAAMPPGTALDDSAASRRP
jgi:pyruvate/2-oxoglutarate dehydrogenase complex dihydrolipoamide dehydrogenase (E3) component